MIKLPDELQALVHLANQLKGEKWTYSRTTPYSRGYITGNDGRTIVQTYDGEVPANVCRYFELADPATILSIADKIQRLNATAQPVSDGWVKCSERMPMEDSEVLCAYKGSGYGVHIWHGQHWDEGDFDSSIFGKLITHWMPLPAASGGQEK